MYNYSKFINVLQASGLTLQEAKYMVQFDGECMNRYKEKFYDYDITKIQTGGSHKSVKYNGQKYKFTKTEDMYGRLMFTLRQDIDSGSDECIHISIEPSSNYVYIDDISNLKGCLKKGIVTNKGGNDLMKIMILLIYQIKDKYKLKYIQLRDNSTKYINGERIILRNLMYLIKGYTWYEKFGFIPCKIDNKNKLNFDIEESQTYNDQTRIYMQTKINYLNLTENDIYKTFVHYDKKLVKSFCKNINKNEDMLIKDFIANMDIKYTELLNDFTAKIVSRLHLYIPQSVCVDINYTYNLVANDNI